MDERFIRTEYLLGAEALQRLQKSRVAVFGIGGVGGYVVEALARSGVGTLDLVDSDTIARSNINRQIIALESTVGMNKVDAAAARIRDINPSAVVNCHKVFYLPETEHLFDFTQYDYVVDAVDTVTAKLSIILRAKEAGVPVISAMGAGNKLDPTAFEVADISKTSVCPLARIMRKELGLRGIKHVKVVYSRELPVSPEIPDGSTETSQGRRQTPGSISFVPPVVGLILAGEVVRDLIDPEL